MTPGARWSSAGLWSIVVGVLHVAAAPVFYADSVRSIIDAGVIASVEADAELLELRSASFWYTTAGLMLILLGLLVLRQEQATGRPPAGTALLFLVTGLWGVLLVPMSGFWFVLGLGALAWRGERHPDRHSSSDEPASVGGPADGG